jgi:hypothetical protein
MTLCSVGRVEKLSVIGLGAEHGDLHRDLARLWLALGTVSASRSSVAAIWMNRIFPIVIDGKIMA